MSVISKPSLYRRMGLPELLPYRWTPLSACATLLCADFGVLAFSWVVLERTSSNLYDSLIDTMNREYCKSNFPGDIALPLVAAGEAMILEKLQADDELSRFFTSRTWYVGVTAGSIVLYSIGNTVNEMRNGSYNWRQEVSPSKLWHTSMFWSFALMTIAPAPTALRFWRRSPRGLALALIGTSIWAYTLYWQDLAYRTKHNLPPSFGSIVEMHWSRLFKGNPAVIRTDQYEAAGIPLPSWYRAHAS